ncbi:DUF3053 family protein [Roseomonas sp. CCTCC AB2023176]|uniref:DUF3053 family protein n=1 Tax=Roseomonas sp. CCTCC AB2023176 TaxID=3342640 RepID=UPI0035DE2FA4
MHPTTRRRTLLAALPLLAAPPLLTACENAEAPQRRALIAFLTTRAAAGGGLRLPVPTAEERTAFGPYAAHWDVIRDFHAAMDARVAGPYRTVAGATAPTTLQDIVPVAKRDELARAREAIGRIRTALAEEFAKTEAARNALRQPDDLRAAYDPVFDRLVRTPARIFGTAFPLMEEALAATERLGELIAANLVRLRVSGNNLEVRDASLRARLDAQMNEVRTSGAALQDAQRRLLDLMNGR